MNKIIVMVALALVACVTSLAGVALAGGYHDGNALYEEITEFHKIDSGGKGDVGAASLGIGYVGGVACALLRSGMICPIGGEPTNGQYTEVVYKYMNDNPSIRHFYGGDIAIAALMSAFPCAKIEESTGNEVSKKPKKGATP